MELPALGVGVGFREPFRSGVFLHRREVDFLEVTADHFFTRPADLELLKAHFTVIPHGLDLSLGSAEGLHSEYLRSMAEVVARVAPPWWSEHIAFTRAGGRSIGHLAPVPCTKEALDALVRNVRAAQEAIPVPLILENISYTLRWPGAEMGEPEFLRRLTEETGCGLLLDVTNLHINARNHGYDARRFLDGLPAERVVQLHFVGAEEEGETLVDSHARPVTPAIWELLETVLAWAPVRGALLERDEALPPFAELLPELTRARALGRSHGRWA